MSKELIKLINNNPDLPIYAWVNGDVCQDDCCYWLGKFTNARIREYIDLDYSYRYLIDGNDSLFKDDTIEWEEYMYDRYIEEDMSEEEAEKKIREELDNTKWEKAIFVYVDLP